ncbi:anoctamin [Thraustotheca clavata]|uniref:Anoctamin n=1 Tax=Thraustotheca clavata TaxID=74557 RepID=A0A1V9ZVP9_9STRA|nr:anoctamin [Thraustotheca clavata]
MTDLVKGVFYACGFAATGWSLMKFMLSVPLKVTDGSAEEKTMHLVLKVRSLDEMAFFLREVQDQSELVLRVKSDSVILHDDNPAENNGAAYLLVGTNSEAVYSRLAEACSLRKQTTKGKWVHYSEATASEFAADENGVVKFTSGEKIDLILYQLRKLNVFLEDGETNNFFNNGDPLFQKAIDKGLITSFFPLHDVVERTHLMESWVKQKSALARVPVMLVRDYCGNEVGFYFAFLGLYTRYLIYPTIVGLAVTLYQTFYGASNFGSALYAVFVVAWAVGFLEAWKRRQSELAWNWGASLDDGDEMLSSEKVREEFEGDVVYDDIDEAYHKVFSFTQRLKRYAITIPILLLTVLAIVIFMLVYFQVEEYVRHNVTPANGWTHGLQYVANLPSAVYAGAVFVIDQQYGALATRLNDYENHRTEMDYTNALIAKLALFQFINNFGLLFYITFFVGNFQLLQTTLGSLLVMRLLIGNITETFIPFLMSESSVKAKVGLTVMEKETKDAVVSRVDVESLLPVYSGTFYDYLELFIQFGQITLFASAYPLASACSLANNLIEQRSDAFKILMNHQRNPRAHHDGIGTWQNAFTILCYVAVLTNCTIIGFNSGVLQTIYPEITPFQTLVAVGIAEHLIIALLIAIEAIVPDVPQAVIDGIKSERALARKQLSVQKEFENRSRRLRGNSEISHSIDDSELLDMGQVADIELPEGVTAVATEKWRAWVIEEKVRRKVLEKEIQKMTNLYTLWIQTEISKSKQLQVALDEARKTNADEKKAE